jgi:hypothetical protein
MGGCGTRRGGGLRPDRSPDAARRAAPPPAVPRRTWPVPSPRRTAAGAVGVIRRDGHPAYRVRNADNVVDGLDLHQVQAMLRHAGVELSDLAETYDPVPRPDRPHRGGGTGGVRERRPGH